MTGSGDGAGAASSLERDLLDEGFNVIRLATRQKVDACGGLFDAVLERGGHVVERACQPVDVGVGAGGQAGVEAPARDGVGGASDVEQRSHDAARRPEPEQAAGEPAFSHCPAA